MGNEGQGAHLMAREEDARQGGAVSGSASAAGVAVKCTRCNDTGWRDPIEGRDGSYITSRPCLSCDAYEKSEDFKAFRRAW